MKAETINESAEGKTAAGKLSIKKKRVTMKGEKSMKAVVKSTSKATGKSNKSTARKEKTMATSTTGATRTGASAAKDLYAKGLAANTKTMWLDSNKLISSPRIQRSLSTSRVDKIVENFEPLLVNPIKVSRRAGKYYVFDGQHTLAALKKVYGADNNFVECKVFDNLTFEKEARLFAQQNGYSESVSMIYKLRALEAAKDEVVLEFLDETRGTGFAIDIGNRKSRNGRIAAIVAAYTAFISLQSSKYKEMLDIIKKTWGGESWSVTKNMLTGMTVFMNMYSDENGIGVDRDKFVELLRVVTASDIRKRAETYRGMAIGSAYGIAIADYYEELVEAA